MLPIDPFMNHFWGRRGEAPAGYGAEPRDGRGPSAAIHIHPIAARLHRLPKGMSGPRCAGFRSTSDLPLLIASNCSRSACEAPV